VRLGEKQKFWPPGKPEMMPSLDRLPLARETKVGTRESSPVTEVEMRFVDPLADPEWDRLVLSHPDASFFHSAAWARVLSKSYGHKPFYVCFSHDGEPLALVPLMEVKSTFTGRRGVCLPFSDFCAPLLFNDCEPTLVVARLSALALEHRWKHLEIRGGNWFDLAVEPAVEYLGHSLDLQQDAERLLAVFSSSVRRAIRKAEQSGLIAEVSRSHESVIEFYRLHVQTRRRHGLPPQPFSFFRNIFDEVIRKGFGFVIRATFESRCVAAAIFFQFGRTAVYKFGASEAASQATRGNNLVMWEGIRFLARGGCESLHFGRTSLANGGLRRFKLGWGTTEKVIRYFQWVTATGKWVGHCDQSKGLHNVFFANMPLAVNRFAGALLYPHLD
jgi:lipid II:glycine glycyltransferase (peptidoglycan interpeptide bridge formation enzyme)